MLIRCPCGLVLRPDHDGSEASTSSPRFSIPMPDPTSAPSHPPRQPPRRSRRITAPALLAFAVLAVAAAVAAVDRFYLHFFGSDAAPLAMMMYAGHIVAAAAFPDAATRTTASAATIATAAASFPSAKTAATVSTGAMPAPGATPATAAMPATGAMPATAATPILPSVARRKALPASSEQFFADFVAPRRPVVFAPPSGLDAALGWRTSRWTDAYLERTAGDATVAVETPLDTGHAWSPFGKEVRHLDMTFRAFLAASRDAAGPRYYLNLQDANQDAVVDGFRFLRAPLSALSGDMNIPGFLLSTAVTHANFWYGVSHAVNGSKSRLHNDGGDNLYVLLAGTKKVVLFSPADALNMYTFGKVVHVHPNGRVEYEDVPHAHFGRPDADHPDLEAFPAFANASRVEVTVHAGEMLFIPAGWYHEVTSYGRHVALNFWFEPPWTQASSSQGDFEGRGNEGGDVGYMGALAQWRGVRRVWSQVVDWIDTKMRAALV